jgi:hypothetical protein
MTAGRGAKARRREEGLRKFSGDVMAFSQLDERRERSEAASLIKRGVSGVSGDRDSSGSVFTAVYDEMDMRQRRRKG